MKKNHKQSVGLIGIMIGIAVLLCIAFIVILIFIEHVDTQQPVDLQPAQTEEVQQPQTEEPQEEGVQPQPDILTERKQEPEETQEPQTEEVQQPQTEEPQTETIQQPHASLTFRNADLLNQHYTKHGMDMGFPSAEEYQAAAAAVVTNPSALHKTEAEDGDDVYYIESTNEFVVVSTDGYIRTYFYPDAGIDYYNRQ